MLRTLRNRLILSHSLPLLLIVPLMGILLIYAIETQYLIPSLTKNLEDDARLIADVIAGQEGIFNNPRLAQELLDRLPALQTESILLITPKGVVLASTGTEAGKNSGQQFNLTGLEAVFAGQTVSRGVTGPGSQERIEVITPVRDRQSRVIGFVSLTYQVEAFYQEFLNLRALIGEILLASLLMGVVLGLGLALNIEAPIQQLTVAVYDLASGKRQEALPERGPEEIRQLQRAANHLVERLQALEESRRKLLANLVHELGRPLGALRAAIQALRRGAKSDPQLLEELLEGMDEEALRLQRLTEELAHLHDQVLGTLELDRELTPLSEWLSRLTRSWQEAAHEKELEWVTSIPPTLPQVWIDPHRFSQAVSNLFSNAIKYTPEGGQVRIEAGSSASKVWIQVSDNGPGIPMEEQSRIFQPFYRGGHGRRFPQGMGLGLSIAHDIVAAHGGWIELTGSAQEGACFTIYLPFQ